MSDLIPLKRHDNFALAEHTYRRHASTVPASHAAHLENPALYALIGVDLTTYDEVRFVADDGSWVALVLIVFAEGSRIRAKTIWHIPLEKVNPADTKQTRYVVKQRGQLKWCVVDTEDGDRNVRQGINTESDAMRQLEEHLRALAR